MLVYRIEHKHAKCGHFTAINILQRNEYKHSFYNSGIREIREKLLGIANYPLDEARALNIEKIYSEFTYKLDTRFGTKKIEHILDIWSNTPNMLQLLHDNDFHLVIYKVRKNYVVELITQVMFSSEKATMYGTIPLTNFIQ